MAECSKLAGIGAIYANSVTGGIAELAGAGQVINSSGFIVGPIDTIQLGDSNTKVDFEGGFVGLLELSTVSEGVPNAFTGDIAGFQQGDAIELTAVQWSSGDAPIFTPNANNNGGVLTISGSSGVIANLNLIGWDPGDNAPYVTANFHVNPRQQWRRHHHRSVGHPAAARQRAGFGRRR